MNNHGWKRIITTANIKEMMSKYGGFHDSCLVSVNYISGLSVGDLLSMGKVGESQAIVTFQRQYASPNTIEMMFDSVSDIHISASKHAGFQMIFDAVIFAQDKLLYWASNADWTPEEKDEFPSCTWISAKKIYWRIVQASNHGGE